MLIFRIALLIFFLVKVVQSDAQSNSPAREPLPLLSLTPAPEPDKNRLWFAAGTATLAYGGASVALWKAWYKNHPTRSFHFFNDWVEWRGMDKAGHLFSSYTVARLAHGGARWTGMYRKSAEKASAITSMAIMSTIELMDGFSAEWGFSWGDMTFNALGIGTFLLQEQLWQEQRITLKISGLRPDYPTEILQSRDGTKTTTLDDRAAGLYGTNFFHVLLKDYNALNVWASFNLSSFFPEQASPLPQWLNIAAGYSAENLFGGYQNKWVLPDGTIFEPDPKLYPRFSQFYLSFDADWSRIPTRQKWLKSLLAILNLIKLPAPALEANTTGSIRWHWLHW